MKYNMKKIMQNAWNLYRKSRNYFKTFSAALRAAWNLAKKAMAEENFLAGFRGKKFEDGMEISCMGYTAILRRWTKGNHDRIYLNTNGTRNYGYVDLKEKKDCTSGKNHSDKMAQAILSMTF